MKNVIINTATKIYVLPLDQIIYIKAKASYSVFILKEGIEVISSQPIGIYNKMLDDSFFFRCHKSYLINLNYVSEIIKNGDVVLIDRSEIPIAKDSIKLLVQLLSAI